MLLSTAILVGHMLVANQFCQGVRTAETQTGMTYHAWYKDYALDTVSQQKILERETSNARAAGLPNFDEIGQQARDNAKAVRAQINSTYAKHGQATICPAGVSNNW